MIDWQKPVFVTMLAYACETAHEREAKAKVVNPHASLSDKALVRVVVDAMAEAAARKLKLGAAIVKLLGKKRG